MTKMLPHRVVAPHKHALLRFLKQDAGEAFPEDPDAPIEIECDAFHLIPLRFADEPVLSMLVDAGLLDLSGDENLVYLPVSPFEAYTVGKSPYGDPPAESYSAIHGGLFDTLRKTMTFGEARGGDPKALAAMSDQIVHFQRSLREALETGQCYAADSYTDENYRRDYPEAAALLMPQ